MAIEDKAVLSELRLQHLADRRWADLVAVVERELAVTSEVEQRRELYEELAFVCVEHLRDTAKAVEAWDAMVSLGTRPRDDEVLEFHEQILELEPGNDRAFELIEPILRGRGDPPSLQALASRLLDRADAHAHDASTFLAGRREAARILEENLQQPEGAFLVLSTALRPDCWQTGILEELERLAHQTGQWPELTDAVRALIGELPDDATTARLRKRLGFWLLSTGAAERAVEQFRPYLRHFPNDDEVRDMLAQLYRELGAWDELIEAARAEIAQAVDAVEAQQARRKLVELLKQAAASTSDPRRRADYLASVGRTYQMELGDPISAVNYFERALNDDPDNLRAAGPLIDMYMRDEHWERAAPLLEMVVQRAERERTLFEPRELNERYVQYGKVCDLLGNERRALEAYRQAYELDARNPWTMQRYGLLLYRAGEHDQAHRIFRRLLEDFADALDREVFVDICYKAGSIRKNQGDLTSARAMFERALERDARHKPSLQALVEIHEEREDLRELIACRRILLESERDPQARFKELTHIGEIWAERANRPDLAEKAYREALEIEPGSVAVLRKLLDVYRQARRWPQALGVLERLLAQESDAKRRANLLYTMGVIARDETRDPMRAVDFFDRALDQDLEMLKAFEAIDRILTEARAWKDLERAYRRMLRRTTEGVDANDRSLDPIRFLLWKNLGEVYRSRLGHVQSAIGAFETAAALRPDDDGVQVILAQLYERGGDASVGAVEQHRRLLKKEPLRAESHHALWRHFMEQRAFDRAWCTAGALVALGEADTPQSELYRKYLGMNLKLARGVFYPELLDALYHPDQDRLVSAILSYVGIGLRAHFARPVKEFGVHPKKDLLDLESKSLFAQMYLYVAKTMALTPPPLVYLRRDHPLGLRLMNTEPPALLIGSDVMENRDDRDLAFTLAKNLCWMRPEHYLGAMGHVPAHLTLYFVSAVDMVLGQKARAGRDGATVIKQLKAMPGNLLLQLQKLVQAYLERASGVPDMERWLTAAEHTTTRMALVLSNDLERAVARVRSDPSHMTSASVEERVTELIAFAGSEAYAQIRAELGLAIG